MPDDLIPGIAVSVDDILTYDGTSVPVFAKVSVPGPDNPLNPGGEEERFTVLFAPSGTADALKRERTGQILPLSHRNGDDILTFPDVVLYRSNPIAAPSPHSVSAYQTIELNEPVSTDLLGRQHLTISFPFIAQAHTVDPQNDDTREVIHGYIPDDRGGRWKDVEVLIDRHKLVRDIQIY